MKSRYIYILILFLSNILTAWGQTASQNYVGTQTMLKAYNSEAEDDSLVAGAGLVSRTEIQYYDGLGRPTYNVQNGQSPSNRNLGTMTEYDNAQSITRNWLAVPVYGSQDYQSAADFKNAASMAHGTEHAFTVTATDALGRDDYWQNAGDAWHTGSRIVKTEYVTNGEKSIIQYSAPTDKNSLVRDGYYAACMLDGMKTTDEDGHILEVYTDMLGRKVLERRNGNNDTYFVYNVLGQLRYVLTPQYQADKTKDTGAYEYRYDSNGNVVKKVIPGCEYMQYWYDTNDRVIAMQDGRMRAGTGNNHHMFYIYDKFGRLAIQGGCTGLAHPGSDTAVLDITAPHDKTVDFGGYTVMYPYNFNNPKAEIVNYYDDYAFVKYCGTLKRLPTDSLRQELIQTPAVEFRGIEYGKGQLTGQFVVDSEQNYTLTAYFYDIRGNVIASRSISSDRTYTSTRTEYTFLNAVRRTVQTVIKGFGTPNARKTGTDIVNTYDERSGKLLHSDLTVTDGNVSKSRRIESYGYDDLGRVSKLEQGNGVHKTSYGYDLHGWTTAVTGDAFTESLGYATGETPCYNGNISSMEWMSADDGLARGYRFRYDGLNRMTDAVYDDAGGGKDRYNETVSYNANGSALTIKRNGRNDAGKYTAIDDLVLYYNGNRLRCVSDKGDACTATGATDFNDGATISLEYTYDACGARTSDANKGIAGIQYSYWGTPEIIQFTNGSQTRYVYDANGVKLKRIHITAVDNIVVPLKTVMELSDDQILTSDTTEYSGSLVFENGRLDKILFSSGYVSCNSDTTTDRFTFHYFVKDHLGNNRVVVAENGAIEQTTHYYPFGNSFADAGTSPSLQHYKYNGKELDRMHGLDWYDYGARNYDPVILQWDRMDQLCEKYHNVSPYVYCHANPINMIDPDGNDDYYTNSGRFLYSDDKATDFIIIRNESLYIQKQLTGAAWINPYTPLANISLSSEAYSKIFTDVLSKMDNVNVTDLHNGKVSVTVWQDDGNMRSTTDQYNDAGLTGGVLAGIGSYNGKQRLTAYVDIFGTAEQKIYSSRSNIQNLLGVHEYIEHFKNDMGNDDNSHLKIYKNMQKHSSWNKTTQSYKDYMIKIYDSLKARLK